VNSPRGPASLGRFPLMIAQRLHRKQAIRRAILSLDQGSGIGNSAVTTAA